MPGTPLELRDPSNPSYSLPDDVREALVVAGFAPAINHVDAIANALANGSLDELGPQVRGSLMAMFAAENVNLRQQVFHFYPEFQEMAPVIDLLVQRENVDSHFDDDHNAIDDFMAALSSDPNHPLEPAIGFFDSKDRLVEQYTKQFTRKDEPPSRRHAWECRIGAAKFYVPPININVNQAFKVSSLGGAGIRQASSAKFNSGHTETTITMTLYFPNQDTIWGIGAANSLKIDFDNDDAEIIDRYISSLRGMITQFKYAPFLPISNDYLNQVFGITAVTMDSMSIATVDDFPFCLAVTLTMSKFNHKVFLPVIEDFNTAIHWGKYRQYIGRAAERMATNLYSSYYQMDNSTSASSPSVVGGAVSDVQSSMLDAVSDIQNAILPDLTKFDRAAEIKDARSLILYYPKSTPARVLAPDLSDLRGQGEDDGPAREQSIWEEFLGFLDFDVNTLTTPTYEYLDNYSDQITESFKPRAALFDFLNSENILVEAMTSGELEKYKQKLLEVYAKNNGGEVSDDVIASINARADTEWMFYIATSWKDSPFFKKRAEAQKKLDEATKIREWEVPMQRVAFDPSYFIMKGVSCTLSNRFAKLQVQMQDEPTYQHIGGGDTVLSIDMIVIGKENLTQFRRLFDHIHGLARLEHAHGVLGFLGIKTVIAGLAGVKYVIPLNFQATSIPGYPDAYQVQLSFVDFDILQQKREDLTSDQQIELIDAFGKRNPFFRLKQLWGATNTYPDLPLAMRDDAGKIVGHLDPDFYFKSFQTFDDDLFSWTGIDDAATGAMDHIVSEVEDVAELTPAAKLDPFKIDTYFPFAGSNEKSLPVIRQNRFGISIGEIDTEVGDVDGGTWIDENMVPLDDVPSRNLGPDGVVTKGNTAFGDYQNEYDDQSSNATRQYELMMRDTQYRNKAGRMIRAFPTYMLWLIDEGGNFAGVKLYDNFYGLSSVTDFSLHQSEDVLGDTLVLRLSNLYQKLTTPPEIYRAFGRQDDPIQNEEGTGLLDVLYNRDMNLVSGTSSNPEINRELIKLSSVRLKPGVRVHLRSGYGANPNALPTLFNGTITAVEQGDIVTVIAQSDAIELGAYVNTTEPNGSSGKIDGGFLTNLWMSEPRDLMVRLLTMGASNFREGIANASRGKVFSQSKFGIRHFGTMLYPPLTDAEEQKAKAVVEVASKATNDPADKLNEADPTQPIEGGFDAMVGESGVRIDVLKLTQQMWSGFFESRDYEIFKRNIYPGNGLGVAQFLGGDLFEIGEIAALAPDQAGSDAQPNTTTGGQTPASDGIVGPNQEVLDEAIDGANQGGGETYRANTEDNTPFGSFGGVDSVLTTTDIAHPADRSVYRASVGNAITRNPFLQLFGMVGTVVDDDTNGLDEVSFRAQTYMKTVWDMFRLCAALLPNYIVAVRPFEDRSTVFYGKPHWLYTSGLIPITTGVSKEVVQDYAEANKTLEDLQKKIAESANPIRDLENELAFIEAVSSMVGVPAAGAFSSNEVYSGQDPATLPLDRVAPSSGQLIRNVIPRRSGKAAEEMHVPAKGEDVHTRTGHKQYDNLPENKKWPGYMDVPGGPAGGEDGIESELERQRRDPQPGIVPGAWQGSMQLTAEEEQFYMAMRWPSAETPGFNYPADIRNARILCFNKRTNKAVVCVPGDFGPAQRYVNQGRIAGLSPDAMFAVDGQTDDEFYFGFVPDATPLGPTVGSDPTSGHGGNESSNSTDPSSDPATNPQAPNPNSDFGWFHPMSDAHDARTYESRYGAFYSAVPIYIRPSEGLYGGDDLNINTGYKAAALYNSTVAQNFADAINERDGTNLTPTLLNSRDVPIAEAEEIWDDFRNTFPVSHDIFNYFMQKRGIKDEGETRYSYLYDKYREALGWDSGRRAMTLDLASNINPAAAEEIKKFNKILVGFMRMLWNNPRSRAWVVVTADRIEDRNSADIPVPVPGVDYHVEFDYDSDSSNHQWSFHDVTDMFKQYIDEYNSSNTTPYDGTTLPPSVITFMEGHMDAGQTRDDWLSRRVGDLQNIFNATAGQLAQTIAVSVSGVIGVVRTSLMSLGQGLNMAGNMQLQANIMNRIFNDSIYYQAGNGRQELLRLVDNPFTREYMEPVVEIREPFQRIHYIDSFQHILDNRIQENLDNVATVITATSNSKYPVTVHFDKGLSAERQIEKTVDTGLYWDNAKGSGFFSMLHPFLHPIESLRGLTKSIGGSPDELLSRRIALANLKDGLKDIYRGEIWIVGNPDIRPHDLVYLADVYSRCYGMFEVEQIVTHFTPELGFVSAITPNAIVTINDPMRWSMISWIWSRFSTQNLRHTTRYMVSGRTAQTSTINNSSNITIDELVESLSTSISGYTQYTHGSSALVKDLAGISKAGMLAYNEQVLADERAASGAGALPAAIGFGTQFNPMLNLWTEKAIWPAWKAIRDNLYDQHGCYIQYLTKDGQALDAGLSYARGVAVGRPHSKSLLPYSLGLSVNTIEDGHARITTDDLLNRLGWKEIDVATVRQDLSWWISRTNSEVLKLSGKSPDGFTLQKPNVHLVIPIKVLDGDTVTIEPFPGDGWMPSGAAKIRLAGVDAAELLHKDKEPQPDDPLTPDIDESAIGNYDDPMTLIDESTYDEVELNQPNNRARLLQEFLENKLINEPKAQGRVPVIAVRINPDNQYDKYGRLLATIFANYPNGTPVGDIDKVLKTLASKEPPIPWDAYMDDGRPYTINWEVIATGLASTDMGGLAFNTNIQ